MPNKKLVIQISGFNEEETLPVTLNALLRRIQGIDKIEVLIINDGSTDRTFEVARNYGGPKPGGHIIVTTPRRGGEFIYCLGSKIGLFSKEACAEHKEKFLNQAFLRELVEKTGLTLTSYEKFLFGFNQLAIYQKGGNL